VRAQALEIAREDPVLETVGHQEGLIVWEAATSRVAAAAALPSMVAPEDSADRARAQAAAAVVPVWDLGAAGAAAVPVAGGGGNHESR
jgi:hypothetical protein